MTVPARISLVVLGVRDMSRAIAFYERLGWRRSSASNDMIAFFATADGVLALHPYDALAADVGLAAGEPPAFRGVTLAINVEGPEDVARILGEAEAAGATVVKQAQRADWGGTSGYFTDPDGYAWEVAHNPYIPFTDGGSLALPE